MSRFIFIFCVVVFSLNLPGEAQTYYPQPDSHAGWRSANDETKTMEKIKIDTNKLRQTLEYIKGNTKNGGLLVLLNGCLVYEEYFGKGSREATPDVASVGKSFTSIAIGILMSQYSELFPEGLDQRIFSPRYFPEWVFPLADPMMSEIKLGQLLTFTAGIRGNNPVYVNGKTGTIDPVGPDGWYGMVDDHALGKEGRMDNDVPFSTKELWCDPGKGYSYSTASIHIASIMLRHITGMELEAYIGKYLGESLGWERWGFGLKDEPSVTHTPGGGCIVLRSTDMLRFGYLLLNEGKWKDQQIIPADYVRLCSKASAYNPHYPYSLQFEVNSNGYWPSLPRDAYWKAGSGGHCLYIVPSLNLVVWKLGGRDGQYAPEDTGFPELPKAKKGEDDRKGWFNSVSDKDAIIRTLEMVIESIGKKT